MLQRYGLDGMEKIADDAIEKSKYLIEKIKMNPDKFELINHPMGTNVCYSYIPPNFRGKEYNY